jgi:integrase
VRPRDHFDPPRARVDLTQSQAHAQDGAAQAAARCARGSRRGGAAHHHGLRRTFNDLLRQVSSGEVVRSIMGHLGERMTEHYSHVRGDEKAIAVGP